MAFYGKFFSIGGRPGSGANAGGDTFANAVNSSDVWEPAADVLEVEGGIVVLMDLPGVDRDSLEVTVDGIYLIVRGIRRGVCPGVTRRFVRMEISRGFFGKIIPLPGGVSASRCEARLTDGVLEILVPFGKKTTYAVNTVRIYSPEG
ncbi:MAG: Hsp20/alpha crystallin family protein [Planctomycetota bacterium]|jgi:HSP20 family protein|nr:Hsp20/alpha crystallin family protein [Planctomycetota bacterium]